MITVPFRGAGLIPPLVTWPIQLTMTCQMHHPGVNPQAPQKMNPTPPWSHYFLKQYQLRYVGDHRATIQRHILRCESHRTFVRQLYEHHVSRSAFRLFFWLLVEVIFQNPLQETQFFPGIGKQQRSIKMESLCKPGNIKPASIFLYTIRTYYITPVIGNRRHIFQSMLPAVPRKQSQVRKGNYRKNSDGWQVPKKLCREFRLGQTPKKISGANRVVIRRWLCRRVVRSINIQTTVELSFFCVPGASAEMLRSYPQGGNSWINFRSMCPMNLQYSHW